MLNKTKPFTDREIADLWPVTPGELLGYANALERDRANITALQIRLAVQLAEEAFARRRQAMGNHSKEHNNG